MLSNSPDPAIKATPQPVADGAFRSRFADLSLHQLLTRENPLGRNDDDLRRTIEFERSVTGSLPPFASYSEHWEHFAAKDGLGSDCAQGMEEIRRRVAGHVLVDLGGGQPIGYLASRMQPLAERFGASAFINVDRYAIDLNCEPRSLAATVDLAAEFAIRQPPMMRSMLCKADMLDFLTRLPDESCNIVMNGIDYFVLHYPDYHRRLAQEIARVVPSGGIAFGINATPLELLASHAFEVLSLLMPRSNQISLMVKPAP